MLAKCANPSCSKAFRYLHEGKLYRVEAGRPLNGQGSPQHSEWFWLCDECVTKVTLRKKDGDVVAVPLDDGQESSSRKGRKTVSITSELNTDDS